MKHLYIYAIDSILTADCRIALSDVPLLIRDNECLYCDYTSSHIDMIFEWVKKELEKPIFGAKKHILRTQSGVENDYITEMSAQSIDTIIFSFLTGDGDKQEQCRTPFVRKRKISLQEETTTIVEVHPAVTAV